MTRDSVKMADVTPTPRSGTPLSLRSGGYTAEVASVGASLRALRHEGRDLVVPFEADEVRPGYRGATLAPWPNRIAAGTYTFAGAEHRTALTDPGRPNALHGLVAWLDFEVVDESDDAVTLSAVVVPQIGYPWRIRITTTYALDADGLTQTVVATNEGPDAAPYGTGPHPYLVAGAAPLDAWTFALDAAQVLAVDDTLVPTGLEDVAGSSRFDWRAPRILGAAEIDHAFTGLGRDGGTARAVLRDPSGTGVEMTWGDELTWVQVHTADLPGGPAQPGHRAGLAVEPMTCAPDAFNADRHDYDAGLIVLEPGAQAAASWRISAL